MDLSVLQIIGLGISILGIAGLAIWSGTRPQSYGKVNGAPIVAGIIMGTLVGGSSTVGTAQLAFNYGMSAWWFTLGGGIGCLLVALVYSKAWRNSGSMTLIGIITQEYGPKTGMAASIMSSLGTFINVIAQLIAGTAVIDVIVPNLGLLPSLLITAGFMTLYVILGGTQGAGMVGILKLVLIYVSMVGCGVMVLHLAGGLGGVKAMISGIANPDGVHFYSLIARGAGKDIGAGISLILGVLTTQTYAQAVMSGKTDRGARTGALVSAFMIPPIGIAGILVGLYMRANFPDIVAKNALVMFTKMYMPPILAGLILGTLFIAVVGTGAGLAMGISTIVRRDIISRYTDKMKDDRLNQTLSKVIIVVVMALGVLLSSGPFGDTILSFGFMSMGLRGAVVFLPMTLALWAKGKINHTCVLISVIASPLTVLLFGTVWTLPGGLDPLFAGIAVSIICCGIGLMIGTKRKTIRFYHPTTVNPKNFAVAIDSALCSKAPEIAAILSRNLHIPCYDSEILTEAATISGIPEEQFVRYDEKFVVAAYDFLAKEERNLTLPPTGTFVQAQMDACRSLASRGPCILINRFASYALNEKKTIKIFVDADFEYRAKVHAELNNIGEATSRKRLRKMERIRTSYYKATNKHWGDTENYSFMVDATDGDAEKLADEITQRIEYMFGKTQSDILYQEELPLAS